jgi:uncharacterized membrane protein YccC
MNGKTNRKTVSTEQPGRVADGIIPLDALQCLARLSETLKRMRPTGDWRSAAPGPMIILTSSGMELRFTGAEQRPVIPPERLAGIEQELKALRQSTVALQEAVAENSRSVEKTLESHSAAIGSVRAALSQNEELVEGIVETLQMLNGVSEDQSEEPLAAAS